MKKTEFFTDKLPLVALRGLVIFPDTVTHFDLGREKSINAMEYAQKKNCPLVVAAQRDTNTDDPDGNDLFGIGTIVTVKQALHLPDGSVRVLISAEKRVELLDVITTPDMLMAHTMDLPDEPVEADEALSMMAAMNVAKGMFEEVSEMRGIPGEFRQTVMGEKDVSAFTNAVAAHVLNDYAEQQDVLECFHPGKRLMLLIRKMAAEAQIAKLEREIQERVRDTIDKNNRDFYLHEQMHQIEAELGEDDEDIREYEKRLKNSKIDGEARERVEKEIKKLSHTPVNAPENNVMENYIDLMLELPWGVYDDEKIDIPKARKVLEKEHYGLEDVKKRILEYLAVRALKKDAKGPILCLVGAPGVGKTSIAKSVANALKRKFVRMSLGGVNDEAEIRGHRKTYIGSMPGRVISAIRQCGTMNPVFLFDEIDKMASDFRGDPASAMLEVLDPEQNSTFRDHYVEAPFDLSRVLFITTANNEDDIPQPLLDRMEIIEVPSYTLEEKVQIAKRHLLPKQIEENGLTRKDIRITDKALSAIADSYTREAGVRQLERTIGAVCRKCAVAYLETEPDKRECVTVKPDDLHDYLGAPRYSHTALNDKAETGVVNGLAWTSVGGEVMPIEVELMPGEGKVTLTGSLGDVMKESAFIAVSYLRANAEKYGIDPEFHKKNDIHVHVPEGAVPKDGPSAGVALTMAILSAVSGRKASCAFAMTGEITLRGKVLPIGGVKEKLLGAYRMGIRRILLPAENRKDLEKLPEAVRNDMEITLITTADEVVGYLLEKAGAACE